MKTPAGKWLELLAAAAVLACVGGCQSRLLNFASKGRESAEFQKKVSSDPFPTAQQSGLLGN